MAFPAAAAHVATWHGLLTKLGTATDAVDYVFLKHFFSDQHAKPARPTISEERRGAYDEVEEQEDQDQEEDQDEWREGKRAVLGTYVATGAPATRAPPLRAPSPDADPAHFPLAALARFAPR